MEAAYTGSVSFRSTSNHHSSELICSVRLGSDELHVNYSYSTTSSLIVLSRRLISISDAAFVRILAFPDDIVEDPKTPVNGLLSL